MALSLSEQLLAVPTWPAFPTVDELDARMAGLSTSRAGIQHDVIGHSRAGAALSMLSVGHGTRHALVLGMPHPNEPTGALASLWLAQQLAKDVELRDGLGLVWHFVPCADPDGTRLNEGWFAGPYDGATYSSRLYRPPFEEQFEWTFHRDDLAEPGLPSTPESRAVMDVIDAMRPELVVSMHNGEDGGLYAYLSRRSPDLAPAMQTISDVTSVPLEHGHPEAPGDVLSPGVFHAPSNVTGGSQLCSTDYAGRYGALGVTSEPPIWIDRRAENATAADPTVTASISDLRDRAREQHAGWLQTLREHVDLTATARGRAVLSDVDNLGSDWPAPEFGSVAEAASWSRMVDLECRRAAGHVVALVHSTEKRSPELNQVAEDASAALKNWSSDLTGDTFVGLDRAVACHVGVALAAAAGLDDC